MFDEDKYIAIADFFTHDIMNESAQETETPTHVCQIRIEVVIHRKNQLHRKRPTKYTFVPTKEMTIEAF